MIRGVKGVIMRYNSELLGKEVEIIKSKLLSFLAICGGSWVYGMKDENFFIYLFATILFILSAYGVFANIIKLGQREKFIKDLKEKVWKER